MAERSKRGRPPSLSPSEAKRRRIERCRQRRKCIVNIGKAISRWNELKSERNFQKDEDLATFLLDLYGLRRGHQAIAGSHMPVTGRTEDNFNRRSGWYLRTPEGLQELLLDRHSDVEVEVEVDDEEHTEPDMEDEEENLQEVILMEEDIRQEEEEEEDSDDQTFVPENSSEGLPVMSTTKMVA